MNISKLAKETKYTNVTNCYNKRIEKVSKITIHHMAGSLSADDCAAMWLRSGRQVSANYIIGKDGEIVCFLDEDKRSWASSSKWNDQKAITIEVANSRGLPGYEISETVYKSLIALCKDICSRYDIKPSFTGNKNGSFTFHYMFAATECPGGYIKGKIQDIIKDIKKEENKPTEPTEHSAEEYKVKITAAKLNIRNGAGTKYKINGTITDKGVYTIVKTSIVDGKKWGKLKSGAGWICLTQTKEVK